MNSNTVLNKIMTLLSIDKSEDKLTQARLADGTILDSPTFDVGESVEVIHEDGEKSPAPDGWHELELRDESGNENRIKIYVEGGVIKERENVELEEETLPVEPLPNTTDEPKANDTQLAEETEIVEPAEEADLEDHGEEEEIKLEDVSKKIEELSYRIEEMEKKLEDKMEEDKKVEEEMEEEIKEEEELEDKKLDGAPVEVSKFRKSTHSKTKTGNYQNSYLSKLYK